AGASALLYVTPQCAVAACLPADFNEDLAIQTHRLLIDEAFAGGMSPHDGRQVLVAIGAYLIGICTMENAALRQTMLAQNSAGLSDTDRRELIEMMFQGLIAAWGAVAQDKSTRIALRRFAVEYLSTALQASPVVLRRRIIARVA